MLCNDIFFNVCNYCNGKSLIKLACINKSVDFKINNFIYDKNFADIFYLKNKIMINFFFMPILNKINDDFKKYIYVSSYNPKYYHYANEYKKIKNMYFNNMECDILFEIFNSDILKKSTIFNKEIYENITSDENQLNDFYYFIKKLYYDFDKFMVFIQQFREKLNKSLINKILIDLHPHNYKIKFALYSFRDTIDREYVTKYVLRNLSINNVEKYFEFIEWDLFSNNHLNYAIVKKYKNNINWDIYSRCINRDMIYKFEKNIIWSQLNTILDLDSNFIEQNYDKPWDWYNIMKQKILSIDCLIKITNFLTNNEMDILCEKQILNNEYIDLYNDKINWNLICKYQKLDIDLIKKYKHLINWNVISEFQEISYGLITSFDNELNWTIILNTKKYMDKCLIEKYHTEINWNDIHYFNNVPEKILILYKDIIDWNKFNYEIKLCNETINIIYDKLNIYKILQYNEINVNTFIVLKHYVDENNNFDIDWEYFYMKNNFILDDKKIYFFHTFVNWISILKKQKLSQNIMDIFYNEFQESEWIYMFQNNLLNIEDINKYHENINFEIIFSNKKFEMDELLITLELVISKENNINNIFDIICEKQKLTENFIDIYKNEIKWNKIWKYQTVSIDFIRKNIHKVIWKDVCKYQILDEQFIKDFHKKVSWMYVVIYQKLSNEFIIEFAHMMDLYRVAKYQKITHETFTILNMNKNHRIQNM